MYTQVWGKNQQKIALGSTGVMLIEVSSDQRQIYGFTPADPKTNVIGSYGISRFVSC